MARTDNSPDGGSVWTSPTFLASGALVALVVVLAAVLALSGGKDDPAAPSGTAPVASTPAGAPTEATQAPKSPTDPKSDSACGLPAGSQDVPTEAPATKWELVGKVAAPTARKSVGPGKIASDGLRSCYAHSPVGALYSAANFIAMTASPSLRLRAAKDLIEAGPGQRRAIREVEADTTSDQESAGTSIQIAGYVLRTYDGGTSLVDLAFEGSTLRDGGPVTGYVHIPLALKWIDGDWKLQNSATGNALDSTSAIPDLSGYTEWSGT